MSDAGREQTDRRQTLLPHQLPLDGLQHFAGLALLLDLPREGAARVAQVRGHDAERILQLQDLQARRAGFCGRRQVAF